MTEIVAYRVSIKSFRRCVPLDTIERMIYVAVEKATLTTEHVDEAKKVSISEAFPKANLLTLLDTLIL